MKEYALNFGNASQQDGKNIVNESSEFYTTNDDTKVPARLVDVENNLGDLYFLTRNKTSGQISSFYGDVSGGASTPQPVDSVTSKFYYSSNLKPAMGTYKSADRLLIFQGQPFQILDLIILGWRTNRNEAVTTIYKGVEKTAPPINMDPLYPLHLRIRLDENGLGEVELEPSGEDYYRINYIRVIQHDGVVIENESNIIEEGQNLEFSLYDFTAPIAMQVDNTNVDFQEFDNGQFAYNVGETDSYFTDKYVTITDANSKVFNSIFQIKPKPVTRTIYIDEFFTGSQSENSLPSNLISAGSRVDYETIVEGKEVTIDRYGNVNVELTQYDNTNNLDIPVTINGTATVFTFTRNALKQYRFPQTIVYKNLHKEKLTNDKIKLTLLEPITYRKIFEDNVNVSETGTIESFNFHIEEDLNSVPLIAIAHYSHLFDVDVIRLTEV